MTAGGHSQDEDLDAAVADARAEFIGAFEGDCAAIDHLIDDVAAEVSGAAARLTGMLHRMAGLGGTIGLPGVSDRARQFEDVVRDSPGGRFDTRRARQLLAAVRRAFDQDLSA